MPWPQGVGHPLRAWSELIKLFSHGRNSVLAIEDGIRWCMHSGSAMMSMMQTTAPVLTGSGPMSKEGRAGETNGIFVRSVPTGALVFVASGDVVPILR
ncbi:hypothetical protein BDN67DRAFT_972011 [Paxillus ammoniavirescens]|nr:hypothetical protein BDN67DRAFT_972011 [Paxillus ammoniavirescens]